MAFILGTRLKEQWLPGWASSSQEGEWEHRVVTSDQASTFKDWVHIPMGRTSHMVKLSIEGGGRSHLLPQRTFNDMHTYVLSWHTIFILFVYFLIK